MYHVYKEGVYWDPNEAKKNDQLSQHTLSLYNTKLKGHVCHRTPNFLVVGVCSMLKGVSLLPGVCCRSIADYIPDLHVPLKNNIHFNNKALWTGDSLGKDTNLFLKEHESRAVT